MHRVQQMHDDLSPRRDSRQGGADGGVQGYAGDIEDAAVQGHRGKRRLHLCAAGCARGLHRLHLVRQSLPAARRTEDDAESGGAGNREGELRGLSVLARSRTRRRPPDAEIDPAFEAADRILRRLHRLRRDTLYKDADSVVRRPADGGERHRLLVDLRRQPADHALYHRGRRTRTGLGQLIVRRQRRIRSRLPLGARPPPRRSAGSARRARRRVAGSAGCQAVGEYAKDRRRHQDPPPSGGRDEKDSFNAQGRSFDPPVRIGRLSGR